MPLIYCNTYQMFYVLTPSEASCLLNKRPGMTELALVTVAHLVLQINQWERVERGQEQVGTSKTNAPIA